MNAATRIQIHESAPLRAVLEELADLLRPGVCIETGTHIGLGSTQHLIYLAKSRPIRGIYTLEISRTLHEMAKQNLHDVPLVHCLWGLSVSKEAARAFIETDPLLRERGPEPDIYIDFLPDPVAGYLQELDGAVGGDVEAPAPDDLLRALILQHRESRPLFCLDSAGGLGLMEFQLVRNLMGSAPYGLWLDDINHVKHYRSMLEIRDDPRFSVVGWNWNEGWLVAQCNS